MKKIITKPNKNRQKRKEKKERKKVKTAGGKNPSVLC
jgi:hypothetical protein